MMSILVRGLGVTQIGGRLYSSGVFKGYIYKVYLLCISINISLIEVQDDLKINQLIAMLKERQYNMGNS